MLDVPVTMLIRSGKSGGKGPLIQINQSATLTNGPQQTLFEPIAYGISSYASNAMKSSNPHSGIYIADTAKTLDQNGGNPACNQGGVLIVERSIR